MTDMTTFEREVAAEVVLEMGPSEPVDDLVILEAITASRRSRRWGFTPFAALRFVAAGVIVALFGGFLLAGVLTTQQGDEVVPAAVTDSPSPMTTEELLSGIVTEKIEPGVFRVDDDGERDLSSADGWRVVAGDDGSVWLDVSGELVRLGGTQIPDQRADGSEGLADLEIAPDGRAWAVVVQGEETSWLRSFDGEAWADVPFPAYEPEPSWAPHQLAVRRGDAERRGLGGVAERGPGLPRARRLHLADRRGAGGAAVDRQRDRPHGLRRHRHRRVGAAAG